MLHPSCRVAALCLFTACCGFVAAADRPAVESGRVRVIFVGDMMLDELPGQAIDRGVDPFEPFSEIFQQADLVVGNLECVIATTGEPFDKKYTFRAHPRAIPVLKRHFNALSLANNHSGDYGDAAFVEMLDLLQGQVGAFGGGRNLREAHRPFLVERNGLRIAILGYNEFKPRAFQAGDDSPGVAWSIDDRVLSDIRIAREEHRADIVIPFMHWGHEYEAQPDERQATFGRAMIDAGAAAVIGAHPHVTQGAEVYRGQPILHSLGNFVFNGFDEPEAKIGWIARLTINRAGVREWDTVVVRIDDEGLPHPDWSAAGPSGEWGSSQVIERVPARETKMPVESGGMR